MSISTFISNIIKPGFDKVEKSTLIKWGFYLNETYNSAKVFGTLYDRLRFRIGGKTYCWAYGSISKCNYGIQMSFIGLMLSLYTLCMSVFSTYMEELPDIMVFREVDLCAWKMGLWFIVGPKLDSWFVLRLAKKYGPGNGNLKDRFKKLERMKKIIGDDVSKVHSSYRWVIIMNIFSLITMVFERWEKNRKNEQEQNKTKSNVNEN